MALTKEEKARIKAEEKARVEAEKARVKAEKARVQAEEKARVQAEKDRVKAEKEVIRQNKLNELTQLTTLRKAQDAEVLALKSTLSNQGLSTKQINSLINAEKKANTAEYSTAKATLKPDGVQNIARDQNGRILSAASAYGDNPDYLNNVTGLLDKANSYYDAFNIQRLNRISGDGSYTGVSLSDLTKAAINQSEDGTFNQGKGSTKVGTSVYKLLNDASTNYGKTFSEDQLGKLKKVGDYDGREVFQTSVQGGYERSAYSLLAKNEDGTYTNIGYTGLARPPAPKKSGIGGFLSSPLGKIALVGGSILTGGALAPLLTPTLGTIGAGVATGGLLGAGTAALTGGNVLEGGLIGGAAGGLLAGAGDALSSSSTDYLGSQPLGDATTGAVGSGSTNIGINPDASSIGISAGAGVGSVGLDASGSLIGSPMSQVFDDGSTLISNSSGMPISGTDSMNRPFTVNNGVGTYADGSQLGGTPEITFGGKLANPEDVQKLLDYNASLATAGGLSAGDVLKGTQLASALTAQPQQPTQQAPQSIVPRGSVSYDPLLSLLTMRASTPNLLSLLG
jgi:hypothetical protein